MHARIKKLHIAALTCASLPAWAVDASLLPSGYTGLGITPTAQILDWGQAATSYEHQVAGNTARLEGHDMALGFGLLPNLEVAGRLATNSLHDNCFSSSGCGVRHLIAAGKVSIPLDRDSRWRLGAGAVDIGGATNYFRTFYGVLTYDNGPLQASLGGAHRAGSGIAGSRSPLGGAFGSIAWQPIPLIRGQVEVSGRNAWAGVRVFSPTGWLPSGWTLSAGANARLNDNALTKRNWWDLSLSIPLYKVPQMRRSPEAVQPSSASVAESSAQTRGEPARTAQVPPPREAIVVAALSDAQLRELAATLERRGFEDISVGRMPDGTIAVRVNNGTFRRNAVDGLGAALGVVARQLAAFKSGYRLVMTQRQIPFVGVTGQADCLKQWIESAANTCTAGELSTPASGAIDRLHDGAAWVVAGQKPAWQTVRVKIGPALRTKIGTEFGALDLDVGANIDAELPLWRGASVDWGVNVPIAHSRNYEPQAIFGNLRIPSGTERVAFTQTLPLRVEPVVGPVQVQVTAGRIGTFYDGVLGSARWEPGEGRHRLSASAGVFRNNQYDGGFGPLGTLRRAYPAYASYRYSVLPTRTDLEATAGQFMNNDRGLQLGMRQWFNDVSVGLYYKRTRDSGGGLVRQLLGLEVSLRLGPRQDWRPAPHVQVGGSDRFAHTVETSIREGSSNPLRLGRGVQAPTPDLNVVNNLDRSGLAYFEDNLPRIREAARD